MARGPLDHQPPDWGWWLASDGLWYPPESAPQKTAPPIPMAEKKRMPRSQVAWIVVAIVDLLAILYGSAANRSGGENHTMWLGTASRRLSLHFRLVSDYTYSPAMPVNVDIPSS